MDENTRVIGFPRGKFKNNRIGETNRAICELGPPVFLVRLTAKSDTVKSIVKEVRDQNNKRLSYEEEAIDKMQSKQVDEVPEY